jgi:hypothetical protein
VLLNAALNSILIFLIFYEDFRSSFEKDGEDSTRVFIRGVKGGNEINWIK